MKEANRTVRRVFLRTAAASLAAAASTNVPTLIRAAHACERSSLRGSDEEHQFLKTVTETYGPEFGPVQNGNGSMHPAKK
jgi:hypothetical protein